MIILKDRRFLADLSTGLLVGKVLRRFGGLKRKRPYLLSSVRQDLVESHRCRVRFTLTPDFIRTLCVYGVFGCTPQEVNDFLL